MLDTATGVMLVVGLVAFATGAAIPPPRAFTGPPDEQMRLVGEHPGRWTASAVGIGAGVVVTLTGLTLLNVQQVQAGAMLWPVVAIVAFGVGTMLFLVELGFRATVTVRVATAKGAAPDWYDPLATWAGAAYWTYMPLAYLSVAATGLGILQTDVLSAPFGWSALVFGLAGAAVYLLGVPRPLWTLADVPGLLYLVTGALGIGVLVAQ
jgi:hypothetical protein